MARKTRKRVLERGLEKGGGRRVPTIPSAWYFRLAVERASSPRKGREGTRRKASPMATWREITFPQLAPQTFLLGSRFSPRLLGERRRAVATGIQPFHRPLSNLYLAFSQETSHSCGTRSPSCCTFLLLVPRLLLFLIV